MAVNLEESLRILEQERRKMEGIEQELPQCMNLLADVMVGLEKELEPWKGERFAREFGSSIPVKRRFEEAETRVNLERGGVEKKKWMRSAQLWVDNPGSSDQWSGENARIVINKV
ncbi:transcription factor HHO5-like [Zingiber officinale]|uniref:transcription factor HHO5-like n=1 Tax=Zingiber officinale TaxID=94328 RepID=UPI001C4A8EC1|nr:transcription factor HHO5-like [Zingiber officinale]